eukprot:351346-Chlamydomonas_euryale.AAC.4
MFFNAAHACKHVHNISKVHIIVAIIHVLLPSHLQRFPHLPQRRQPQGARLLRSHSSLRQQPKILDVDTAEPQPSHLALCKRPKALDADAAELQLHMPSSSAATAVPTRTQLLGQRGFRLSASGSQARRPDLRSVAGGAGCVQRHEARAHPVGQTIACGGRACSTRAMDTGGFQQLGAAVDRFAPDPR